MDSTTDSGSRHAVLPFVLKSGFLQGCSAADVWSIPPSEIVHQEKKLSSLLRDGCAGRELSQIVIQLQDAYQNAIFADQDFSNAERLEGRLWTHHYKLIKRFQHQITVTQEENGKRKPVEARKTQDSFIMFLRQATRFYRSFIQRMDATFQIRELQFVIQQFHLPSKVNVSITPDDAVKTRVIRSCHRTLVYLGDLSRYREMNRCPQNWGPAIGYYTLAKQILPSSGNPHNQLAVMALEEGSLLSALYHLYRAVSVKEPFPEADANLSVGFRKAFRSLQSGKPAISQARKEEQVVKDLIHLFVTLHVKCSAGKDFPEYESVESDMLTQLALDLKDRNLSDGMLVKLVLINISAQHYSLLRAPKTRSLYHPASFLRLNIASFTTLHQVFQPELERPKSERYSNDLQTISAVGRRMLPSLRLYSIWLRSNHHMLVEGTADSAMAVLIKQLWQTYANTLSLLAATFDIKALNRVEYPLEEDKEIMGFQPFDEVIGPNHSSFQEPNTSPGHPNEEMLARIRFLLEDGITLCQRDDVPLTMNDGTITYKEDGILTSTPSIGMNSELNNTNDAPGFLKRNIDSHRYSTAESVYGQAGTSIVGSTTGSETMNIAMNRMVDALVGPPEQPESDNGRG